MQPRKTGLDPTKLLILKALETHGMMSVEELRPLVSNLSRSSTGKALRNLWDRKLVTQSFNGNKSFWRIRGT